MINSSFLIPHSSGSSMSTFSGRVALITGGASGIGKQLALNLVNEGAAVAALDRNADALAAMADAFQGKPYCSVAADVTQAEELRKAVAQVEERLGPVDLLFSSAGVGLETSALDFRAEVMETIIRVNLLGVSHSIAAVLPGMIRRRTGHIVALSSLASYRGMPLMAGYCASKSGVNALMEALRVELRGHNIHFTTICPGWIRTPMTANLKIPLPGLMEVDEAARRILDAVRRRRLFCAFPRQLTRRVRLLRWLPCGMSDWIIARLLGKLKK
jgi:NAD(P)-dependent dehydrogenase (short-subunit alcohol dehydrogenase family)